jgi:hypothetical protein
LFDYLESRLEGQHFGTGYDLFALTIELTGTIAKATLEGGLSRVDEKIGKMAQYAWWIYRRG